MTNDQRPPSPAERPAFVPSLAPAEHDDSVPFQHSSRSNQPDSKNTASHAHSHWQSHLRRRFAHSRPHLSSFSTSSPDDELETTGDSEAGDRDIDDLSPRSDNQEAQQDVWISGAAKADADADARPADSEPFLVPRVVQTVELVRVVDTEGRVIETQMVYPSSDSTTTDSPAGETAIISAPGSSGTAVPGTVPGASESAPYPTSATTSPDSATASVTSLDGTQSLAPTTSGTIVPTISTSIPSLSSISASHHSQNATNTPFSSNSSSASSPTTPASTPTLSATILSFTSTPVSSSTSTSLESTISSFTDESWSSLDTDWASPTGAGSGVGRGRNGGGSNPTTTSTAAGGSNAEGDGSGSSGGVNLTQQEKQIVGGVVGGVAGAAFFLLFILMAIKWKKRRNDVQELIGERGLGSRGLPSSRGDDGAGDAPPMAQRSSSFGVAGAFASFTGRKSQPPPPVETGERGFYRVSGKKLPSVLQHGGDGYSDPRRHSTGSGSTEWHRGSQSFEPSSTSPLQLGSPMRPVSGVAIMRSGPARTPVTEQNPFADPPSPTNFPLPPDTHSFDRGPYDERGGPTGFKFQESI